MELNELDLQLFNKGANTDTAPEFIRSTEGEYYDARNMRKGVTKGYNDARVKIGGELAVWGHDAQNQFVYPNGTTDYMTGYECVGFTNCKDYLVGFWTDGSTTRVTIDNKIVCESTEVGLTTDHPLQLDINESCVGGEVFTTDFNVVPMIWPLQDLLDNFAAPSDKYFSGFTVSYVGITLDVQHDKPVFIELSVEGGTNGLKVGNYAYAMRYVDGSGNRTKHSSFTPTIPVIWKNETASLQYYNTRVRGSVGSTNSPFGITINFRVTNLQNYSYIELIRLRWDDASPLSTTPDVEVLQLANPLSEGQISIEEFTDNFSFSTDWATMTPEEATVVLSSIRCAKAIRYYNNRLELGNIKYPSKDLDITLLEETTNNTTVYPYVQNLGRSGHADPWQNSMFKEYLGGEMYGIGIQYNDLNYEPSFVQSAENITYPNRRTPLEPASKILSVDLGDGAVQTMDVYNTDNQYVHETYQQGTVHKRELTQLGTPFTVRNGNYHPITPTNQDDASQLGHQYCVMDQLFIDPTSSSGVQAENCSAFGEIYYATGLALHGVQTPLPDYIKSFDIVRTEPVGRVKSQGLITYAFDGDALHKHTDKAWYFSTDSDNGFSAPPLVGDCVQCVAPIGFSSEIYNAFNNNEGLSDFFNAAADTKGIDLIAHATLQDNNSVFSPGCVNEGLIKADGSLHFRTAFGEWRNDIAVLANNPFYDGVGSINADTRYFKITAVDLREVYDGNNNVYRFYELSFGADAIYLAPTQLNVYASANTANVQTYHEPFYIANIVNRNIDFPSGNIQSYIQTGYSQKVRSIIGDTDTGASTYYMVDERHEDFTPYPNASDRDLYTNFIIIKDKDSGTEEAWMDVTYKDAGTIATIQADITNNGYYVAALYPAGSVASVNVYGIYTSVYNTARYGYNSSIDFSTYGKPAANKYIIVDYDNRFPFKFFGGDVTTSINVGCAFNGHYDKNGDNGSGTFNFGSSTPTAVCFPYPKFKFHDNSIYTRIKNADATAIAGYAQNTLTYKMGDVRQLIYEWVGETRQSCVYSHNSITAIQSNYPRIHYILGPEKWDAGNLADNFGTSPLGINRIDNTYNTTYPDWAQENWGYGGFQVERLFNVDYIKNNTYKTNISKPIVGFTEVTDFCSQIIWSNERNIAQQDIPNLKTFPALNKYNLPDVNGEIKYLFDAESSKGDNLYAFTEKGIAFLITDKDLMADAVGNQLTIIPAGNSLINGHIWLRTKSGSQGMNDEMWRSAAEWDKSILWANSDSCYILFDNQISDLGRMKYHTKLRADGLSIIAPSYDTGVSATFDKLLKEYWLTIQPKKKQVYLSDLLNGNTSYALGTSDDGVIGYVVSNYDWLEIMNINLLDPDVYLPAGFTDGQVLGLTNSTGADLTIYYTGGALTTTLTPGETGYFVRATSSVSGWTFTQSNIFSNTFVVDLNGEQPSWNGTYSYNFDKYTHLNGMTYGVKSGVVYSLNDPSNTLDGSPIACWIIPICNAKQPFDKEFIGIAVNSVEKPTSVEFANVVENLPEAILSPALGANYLKDYRKWVNKIPRKTAAPRYRVQGRYLASKIWQNTDSDFTIFDNTINYKVLKLQM